MLFKKEKDSAGVCLPNDAAIETTCTCQNCKCGERTKEIVERVFSELLKHSIVVESPNSKGEFIEVVRMTDVYHQLCDGHKINTHTTIYGEEWS